VVVAALPPVVAGLPPVVAGLPPVVAGLRPSHTARPQVSRFASDLDEAPNDEIRMSKEIRNSKFPWLWPVSDRATPPDRRSPQFASDLGEMPNDEIRMSKEIRNSKFNLPICQPVCKSSRWQDVSRLPRGDELMRPSVEPGGSVGDRPQRRGFDFGFLVSDFIRHSDFVIRHFAKYAWRKCREEGHLPIRYVSK